MYYYEVAPSQIIRAGSDTFTYSSPTERPIGSIVLVEVGSKHIVGIIMEAVTKPSYSTKPLLQLVEDIALPGHLVGISRWMSDYYHTPLATVLQTILPRGLTKKRRPKPITTPQISRKRTQIVLNKEQVSALSKIDQIGHGTMLLHGVTGSGKTTLYIEQAKKTLAGGSSAIILVPEIALTSQVVDEFRQHFPHVVVAHSKQTEADRHRIWSQVLIATEPLVVVGPRSALFLPLAKLGLVVIDECHEPSFQQEQSPRYSALRVASQYAKLLSVPVIFGSATPLISDYYLAVKNNAVIELTKPAVKDTVQPDITCVDMTKRPHFKQHRFLSDTLLRQLEATFANGKQALIFHNRRGSASTTLCEHCGWQAGCPRCYVPLTLHADAHELRCHICGLIGTVPTSCPVCHHADIVHKGIGTKLIESELKKRFPDKRIVRFDGDSTADESVEALYADIYGGAIDLLVGTQVVAKGLNLPHLRTVGVVQADAGLSLPDYSSPERTFQLLAQVIGRVGRSHHKTTVIVQSYQPTHPVIIDGIAQNYHGFYERSLKLRAHTKFPPYVFLMKLTCIYKTERSAITNAKKLAEVLRNSSGENVEILGPTPAFYERTRDTYRWQLVIKSSSRSELLKIVDQLPPAHWQFELDPISLL